MLLDYVGVSGDRERSESPGMLALRSGQSLLGSIVAIALHEISLNRPAPFSAEKLDSVFLNAELRH